MKYKRTELKASVLFVFIVENILALLVIIVYNEFTR